VIPQAICSRYGLYVGSNFVGLVRVLMIICFPIAYPIGKGLNKQETADRYEKEQVHEWRRSYDTPPPNGESLKMCAERAVASFRDQIEPQLLSGKNVMIAAHGNSLRSIILYLDKLTSQE
ncbi:hypothetical protein S245_039659, partial [Arachis hypogaea]